MRQPWPVVDEFLRNVPVGAVGVDIGCGNGKYLAVNRDVFIVASDRYIETFRDGRGTLTFQRSKALIQIAQQHQPHSAVVADLMSLPHPIDSFDFAISIAVVHHLSTSTRRVQAIREILMLLKPPEKAKRSESTRSGSALIFVWALEQKHSRRGWDRDDKQDVLVPWVLKQDQNSKSKLSSTPRTKPSSKCSSETLHLATSTTYQRYYHLYREGELQQDVVAAGGKVTKDGYDRDNWWVICARQD